MTDKEKGFAIMLGYPCFDDGDPARVGEVLGRIDRNESGIFYLHTPGGSVIRSGLSHVHRLNAAELEVLEGFEQIARDAGKTPYDVKAGQ